MFKTIVPFACALAVAGGSSAFAEKDNSIKLKEKKTKENKLPRLKIKCAEIERKIDLLKKLIEVEVERGNQRIELWIPVKQTDIDLEKATETELKAIKEIREEVLELLEETCKALGIKKQYSPRQQKQN